jgi:hypothetical protein
MVRDPSGGVRRAHEEHAELVEFGHRLVAVRRVGQRGVQAVPRPQGSVDAVDQRPAQMGQVVLAPR